MRLTKGDRVTWIRGGQRKFGVVQQGGTKKASVIEDGGELLIKGPITAFEKTDHPLPNAGEVNPMEEYSIKAYKEIQGHGDSRTFEAKIYKNGKAVLHVSNNGWGGPNNYHPVGKSAELKEFYKKAKEWAFKATGRPDLGEPEDMWVEWEFHWRPYGESAQHYLRDFAEIH